MCIINAYEDVHASFQKEPLSATLLQMWTLQMDRIKNVFFFYITKLWLKGSGIG